MSDDTAAPVTAPASSSIPRLVFTDIDGVWTDGGMYYAESGEEFKRFNTADSAGVLLLRRAGARVVIITGEHSRAAQRRGEKLGVDAVFVGVRDKLATAMRYAAECGIDLSDAAHVGDDVNDLDLLTSVGLSACPSSAPAYIQQHVSMVLAARGGDGAFREFAERVLVSAGLLESAVDAWRQSLRDAR